MILARVGERRAVDAQGRRYVSEGGYWVELPGAEPAVLTLEQRAEIASARLAFDIATDEDLGGLTLDEAAARMAGPGWGPWVELELINGWRPLGDFWPPPRYRMSRRRVADLQLYVEGGELGTAVCVLPEEARPDQLPYEQTDAYPIGDRGVVRVTRWRVEENGEYVILEYRREHWISPPE